jgi:hypothetical protein
MFSIVGTYRVKDSLVGVINIITRSVAIYSFISSVGEMLPFNVGRNRKLENVIVSNYYTYCTM